MSNCDPTTQLCDETAVPLNSDVPSDAEPRGFLSNIYNFTSHSGLPLLGTIQLAAAWYTWGADIFGAESYGDVVGLIATGFVNLMVGSLTYAFGFMYNVDKRWREDAEK